MVLNIVFKIEINMYIKKYYNALIIIVNEIWNGQEEKATF